MIRAGFIGLGSQGAPMARRIVDAGHPLTIWARRPETLEPFADTPAVVATTPAELASNCEVVGICVMADADVEDVVLRDDGVLAGLPTGGIIAIHSTVHPRTCRTIATAAAERGVKVLDAPVSGGAPAASEGHLLVMVGGDDDVLESARPVFATYGDPILHLGPLGSGQVAKVLNNFLFTAQLAIGLETFAFAEQLGIDKASMAQVLATGSGGSRGVSIIAGGGFGTAGLKQVAETILAKDVSIMFDIAAEADANEPPHVADLARAALQMYAEG